MIDPSCPKSRANHGDCDNAEKKSFHEFIGFAENKALDKALNKALEHQRAVGAAKTKRV